MLELVVRRCMRLFDGYPFWVKIRDFFYFFLLAILKGCVMFVCVGEGWGVATVKSVRVKRTSRLGFNRRKVVVNMMLNVHRNRAAY